MSSPRGMFPVRHWFDDSADLSQPESSSLNFPDAVTDTGNVPLTDSRQNTGNTVNRRGAQSAPITGTVYADSGCEDEVQQPPLGADGTTGTESRRPPTRSASRGGRLRSSVDTRISGVIRSRNAGDDSSIVDGQVQFSAINVASAPAPSSSDSPSTSPSLLHGASRPERRGAGVVETGRLRRRYAQMPYANEVLFRDVLPVDLLPHDPSSFQRRQALDQPESRGRRSLSDFLREIEEMVRAQRAEVGTKQGEVIREANGDKILLLL